MSGQGTARALALESLTYYLQHGRLMDKPAELPDVLLGQAGAFVSFKKGGHLRGCIGTFAPTRPTIAEEIIQNAVSAGTEDPRFPPIGLAELSELEISVDVLEAPEQIYSLDELDPKKYGVIVRNGRRSGLLLPDLEGVDTATEQVEIAMEKAGIRPDEEIDLYRFTVTRYK
ncbi:AmmeMemoRadiSam system protein A [Sporomusa sp.]|uniref:AmmeMemoRadiSam system protein A n=1 Tax=Sporomusa sp. TaxID=2078658 RepID=UPI002D05FBD7|nr:AmmeMemoRadiSam system protein A [Sporomusa sp.]HWR44429.1 AmmeMemoRadiSam system protein A [Sporomusa sp.]